MLTISVRRLRYRRKHSILPACVIAIGVYEGKGHRQGGGGGVGGLSPPNFWVKKDKGGKKHLSNKKGYPSQTHPHCSPPPNLNLVYALEGGSEGSVPQLPKIADREGPSTLYHQTRSEKNFTPPVSSYNFFFCSSLVPLTLLG